MKNTSIFIIIFTTITLSWWACTPKTVEQAQASEPVEQAPPLPVEENLSPCGKFKEASNPDNAETAHVLYRDFLKVKNYDEAYKYWQKAFELAPAADGKRDYHFTDGVKIYEHYLQQETDETKRKEYVEKIFGLYDKATECYPDNASVYKGLKAFKLYYSFPDMASQKEIYALFKEVFDKEGEKTPDFVVNPFTALMIDLLLKEEISQTEAQKYANQISEVVNYGIENCETPRACERWAIVESYAPARLEALEGVEGFYDCSYYKERYFAALDRNPSDCDTIGMIVGRLKWGKCPDSDAALAAALAAKQQHCYTAPPPPGELRQAVDALNNGQYNKAITHFENFIQSTDDIQKKAKYNLVIAKVYYSNLKKFSSARTYARKAIDLRPDWGEPHLLIGKLYASSGPLCGPGRGFDSQRVTWVAIDEWNKAKRKDSSTATEANKLISRYRQYMPTKEDIFLRNLKAGDSYKVPCWIQQNTTIRTAD